APGDQGSTSVETMLESAIKRHENRVLASKMLLTQTDGWEKTNSELMMRAISPDYSCDSDSDCYYITEGYCEWGNEKLRKTIATEGDCGIKKHETEEKDVKKIDCSPEDLAAVLQDSDLIVIGVHGIRGQFCGFKTEKSVENPGFEKVTGAAIEGSLFKKQKIEFNNTNPLVVMMSCYGGAIDENAREGLLANKFIDAGAAGYLGSTRVAYQDYTPEFVSKFLKEIKKGRSAGEALKTIKVSRRDIGTAIGDVLHGASEGVWFKARTRLQYYGDPTLKFDLSGLS
ncbi:MAG: C25 family cysteine peptidase, partial [Candidatus Norongarragalinales archaeon]